MSICLYSIGVKQNAMLLCDLANLFDRLDGSDLVVCKHNGNENGSRADSLLQLISFQNAVLVYIDLRNLETMVLQPLTGMQNGMVLDLAGNDMVSLALVSLCGCL